MCPQTDTLVRLQGHLSEVLYKYIKRAGCVAQLAERLLPTPVVRSSNQVIAKIYIERLVSTVLKR